MFAEDHRAGASVGPLVQKILIDQFQHLRDGDRFWYEWYLEGEELEEVRNTTLSDIIKRNTTITNLQDNVFRAPSTYRKPLELPDLPDIPTMPSPPPPPSLPPLPELPPLPSLPSLPPLPSLFEERPSLPSTELPAINQ